MTCQSNDNRNPKGAVIKNMASTSSYFYADAQKVIDDIDQQFQLGPEKLTDLTNAFLEEFALGLGEYKRPMAMMSVCGSSIFTALTILQSNLCHRGSRWHGKRVCYPTIPFGSCSYSPSTFLALDLGGTNL